MGLSIESREQGLKAITTGKLWLGLAHAIGEDRSITEVTDPTYARQPVIFGEVKVENDYSIIANAKAIDYAAFAFESKDEIRYWFLIDKATGAGKVKATGQLDPRWMVAEGGKMYTVAEAALLADKAALKPVYLRPLAGEGFGFDAGDVWLTMREG